MPATKGRKRKRVGPCPTEDGYKDIQCITKNIELLSLTYMNHEPRISLSCKPPFHSTPSATSSPQEYSSTARTPHPTNPSPSPTPSESPPPSQGPALEYPPHTARACTRNPEYTAPDPAAPAPHSPDPLRAAPRTPTAAAIYRGRGCAPRHACPDRCGAPRRK